MDITVGKHIATLEARMNALATELMDEKDRAKRNAVESENRYSPWSYCKNFLRPSLFVGRTNPIG